MIAILGCGPTGLLAAHACALADVEFRIFSKRRKSQLYGSQYLHEPIPGVVTEYEGRQVKYVNVGTPEEYRRKTHGKFWDGIIAPEDFETEHMAWDIREAYHRLWLMYGGCVEDFQIPSRLMENGKPDWAREHPYLHLRHELDIESFDLVISTVPRNMWAVSDDQFIYSLGWAIGDAPENGTFVPYEIDDMTIECNGSKFVAYNRLSNVFGYKTVEWPAWMRGVEITAMTGKEPSRLVKPLRYIPSGMNCPWNSWLHVGRYGQWQKGILTTDAFKDVTKRLEYMR